MMNVKSAALFLLLAALCACTTVDSLSRAPAETGRSFHLSESCSAVAPHLIPVLTGLRMRIESRRQLDGCGVEVIAARPITALSWGELVRVRLVPTAEGTALVIYTQRVVLTNYTARDDWAIPIYQALVNQLHRDSL